MTSKLQSRAKRARSNRSRSKPSPARQLLLLLNGLQILDDRAHVLRREDELRHVRMAGGKALRQSLGKAFDLVSARERSEGRSRRVRAGAGAADGMAARAIRRQQELATSRGRGGLLCQDRPRHAHGDHRDEIIESLPAHMLLLAPPAPHGRIGVATKSKMGSPALIWLKSAMRLLDESNRYRVAQDALEASASESRIPAIKAMRTRSDRLAACILIMRLAR